MQDSNVRIGQQQGCSDDWRMLAEGGEAYADASGRAQRTYSCREVGANVGVVVADAAAHTDCIHPCDAGQIDDGDC